MSKQSSSMKTIRLFNTIDKQTLTTLFHTRLVPHEEQKGQIMMCIKKNNDKTYLRQLIRNRPVQMIFIQLTCKEWQNFISCSKHLCSGWSSQT
mmetsp:Transcript_29119/g.37547  ORF Transcript_29119/g.37547 Transcript_29119/m.37547 type:complete len:93 (-) Transcript_29119:1453-1731(-)